MKQFLHQTYYLCHGLACSFQTPITLFEPSTAKTHAGCRQHLASSAASDPDTLVNTGCVLCKEGRYEEALKQFNEAATLAGLTVSNVLLWRGRRRGKGG